MGYSKIHLFTLCIGWLSRGANPTFVPVNNVRDEKYLKDFGENLRVIRTKRKMTQEDLGLDAGLGKNQVGLIERGDVNVTISTLKKLAKSLKLEPKELLDF